MCRTLPSVVGQDYSGFEYIIVDGASQDGTATYLKERQMTMLDAADDQALRRQLKPKKEKTTEVTLRMFSQGMTKEQIATERGMAANTVMSHLATLVGEGRLKIEQVITTELRQKIEKVAHAVGLENGITPIKNLCPPEVSWDEVKMVINSMSTPKNGGEVSG